MFPKWFGLGGLNSIEGKNLLKLELTSIQNDFEFIGQCLERQSTIQEIWMFDFRLMVGFYSFLFSILQAWLALIWFPLADWLASLGVRNRPPGFTFFPGLGQDITILWATPFFKQLLVPLPLLNVSRPQGHPKLFYFILFFGFFYFLHACPLLPLPKRPPRNTTARWKNPKLCSDLSVP